MADAPVETPPKKPLETVTPTPSGVTLGAAASPEQLANIGRVASELVKDGDTVGLGSGRAALSFVRELGTRVKDGLTIVGVPTSIKTADLATELGIPLATLETVESIDIAVDGADEVAPGMALIKGGGGNMLREKIVESIAKRLVILVGEEKVVPHLGTNFPVFVEVVEFGRATVERALKGLGATEVTQRMRDGAAFLTDDGNPYLHAVFPVAILEDPLTLDTQLRAIPGVVGTGIFVGMATEVFIAKLDGSVEHRTA